MNSTESKRRKIQTIRNIVEKNIYPITGHRIVGKNGTVMISRLDRNGKAEININKNQFDEEGRGNQQTC